MKTIIKNRFLAFLIPLFFLFSSCNYNLANKFVSYKVSYYLQNIEDDGYTLLEIEDQIGVEGDFTKVSPKEIEGFTLKDFDQVKITENMDFSIKYDRNQINLIFNLNGGTVTLDDGIVLETFSLTGRFGSTINAYEPVKPGYILDTWYTSDGTEITETFTKNNTYIASYIEKSETTYTVHHYFQNIDNDDYTEDSEKLQTLSGITGQNSSAEALEIEGFTAKSFEQKKLIAQDSNEINIYYDRNLITLSFNLSGGEGKTSITGKYGELVKVSEPAKEGAKFSGWSPNLPQNFTKDSTFTAVYDMPSYKVKYLFENLSDSDYSEDEAFPAETYLGTVGQTTNVAAKTIKGFVPQTIQQKTVLADKSTVVEVKYTRRLITIFIDLNKGTGPNYIQGKFSKEDEIEESHNQIIEKMNGFTTNTSDNPFMKVGFTFDNFSYDSDLAFTLENDEKTSISVIWNGGINVFFTVNVYHEAVSYNNDEEKYELIETYFGDGLSDSNADISLNESNESISAGNKIWKTEGFKPLPFENQILAGNDSTVFNIYFDRKEITYIYKLNGGKLNGSTEDVKVTGKFGTPVVTPDPIHAGYSCTWKDSSSRQPDITYGAIPVEYTANWTLKKYKIHRHFENEEDYINDVDITWSTSQLATGMSSKKNSYGNYFGGWSLNSDFSSYDYDKGSSNKFVLPDEVSLQTEIDLYALWNTKYKVCHYKEDESGKFIKSDTQDLTTVFTKDLEITANTKTYSGYYAYKPSSEILQADNSLVLHVFYTKNNLSESAAGQVDLPVFITDNSDKKFFADIIRAKTSVPSAKVLASSDSDGKIFYDLSKVEGVPLFSKTVSLYAVKDGMYTSHCSKNNYDYYLGTKLIENGVELYDVCFNDGTCLPSTYYMDEYFSFSAEQKSGVKDIIFYKNTEDSDLGARTLAIYVDSINKTKDAFYSTTNYESNNVSGLWYTIGDYLKANPKDGSGLNDVFESLNDKEKGYCWAYFHCIKPLLSEGNYYIPTFDEEAKLISNRTVINTALNKLGKEIINTNYYYLNTKHEQNFLSEGGWKYYQSLLIKGDGSTKWELIQKKTGYVLAIRKY